MITYLGSLMMNSSSFLFYVPLILTGYLETADTAKNFIDKNPRLPLISMFKDTFTKGVQFKGQFLEMRSDIEIYLGFYLIIGWFLGWSNLIQIVLFWQLMRVRYMMSYNIQGAFRRLDTKLSGFLNSASSPAIIRTAYLKIKGFMVSMTDISE